VISVPDYRTLPFSLASLDAAGTSAGRSVYRQLYGIENILRVVIHSVLTAQIGGNWWGIAVAPGVQNKVRGVQASYAAAPGRTPAVRHPLYYTFLPDLSDIIRPNTHLFLPAVPDIATWLVRIERIRLPRNIVGHMNWPTQSDRRLIRETYRAARGTIADVLAAGVPLIMA
jgi:hypothetical protein